jgi:hypothetical protein
MNIEIDIFTVRTGIRFEECVREETAHLTTLKSKSRYVDNLPKDTAEIETGMTESPALGPGKQTVKWFGLEK